MSQIILQANHCWIDAFDFDPKMLNIPYGIYILGVRSNHEGETRILPFYVGETKKNILEYLKKDRIPLITSKDTKWTIFSEDFLRNKRGTAQDFIKRYFSPKQKKIPQFSSSYFGNDILYFNSGVFFSHHKIMNKQIPSKTTGKKDWPLSVLNNPISQTIFNQATLAQQNIFKTKGSFFFTPVEVIQGKDEFEKSESFRKSLETFVKFSLKINTIGKSNSINQLNIFLTKYSVNLVINCPDIDQEFHPHGNRLTNLPTTLFP